MPRCHLIASIQGIGIERTQRIYWIFGEDFKTSTFLFFPFGPQTDRERNRTETVRIPNGSRTDPVRTPYGPRTPLERTPRGPRADPARTPREPRADPERTPNGPRTNPERTPNGPRGYEIFSETRLRFQVAPLVGWANGGVCQGPKRSKNI